MKKMSDLLKGTFSAEQSPTGNMSIRDFLRLIEDWQELLKGFVAENTLPYQVKGKDLYVATLHPTLAQELTFMEREIYLKIIKKYPEWAKKLGRLNFKYYPGFNIKDYISSLKEGKSNLPSKQIINESIFANFTSQQKQNLKISSQDIPDPEIKQLLNSLIDKL